MKGTALAEPGAAARGPEPGTAPAVPVLDRGEYLRLLKAKIAKAPTTGFDVPAADIHPALFPHQRDIVRWALKGGRRAIFAGFGLGKSSMQLEIMRHILAREGGKALIVCPLGVKQEFAQDARNILGMEPPVFIRRDSEIGGDGLYICNYQAVRDGRVTASQFTAATLDESAVLRSFGSRTYQEFLPLFGDVKYRFVATATPSPNRFEELLHYSAFLGVLDSGQGLTRFFKRDSRHAGNLTLTPHREAEFWLWLSTWACFAQRPSDLGHSDDGYDLPGLEVRWHEVESDPDAQATFDRDGQGRLYRDAALGVSDAAREKRLTLVSTVT
jgi:hypothetical protein